jgi:hypothetical protein
VVPWHEREAIEGEEAAHLARFPGGFGRHDEAPHRVDGVVPQRQRHLSRSEGGQADRGQHTTESQNVRRE